MSLLHFRRLHYSNTVISQESHPIGSSASFFRWFCSSVERGI